MDAIELARLQVVDLTGKTGKLLDYVRGLTLLIFLRHLA
jgi:hypothetical protein